VKLSALMQLLTARHNGDSGQSPPSSHTVCETRTNLLDRLAGILANLRRSTLALTNAMENESTFEDASSRFEVERLLNDCHDVRIELECHRKEHGC
jgi:hypothetical protein